MTDMISGMTTTANIGPYKRKKDMKPKAKKKGKGKKKG